MKIAQVFAHTVVRRLAYVLVAAVLAWCGMGKAHAQAPTFTCGSGAACDRQQAYTQCQAFANYSQSQYPGHTYACTLHEQYPTNKTYRCRRTSSPVTGSPCMQSELYAFRECDAPKVWNESTKTCFDPSQCLAKPALGNAFTVGGSGTTCKDGCQFAPTVSVCANGICSVSGAKPTGQVCGVDDKPPTTNTDQQCTPAGSGQTYCVKPDGRQCYTASAGRQVCWRPGETGEKPDQDTLQKRDAGTEPVAPNVNLPNNDTLTPKGPPVVSNTQVKDSNGTRNITTVTQNYGTTNGTNAGSGNSGENGNGTGGTGSGPGEGDGEGDEPGQPGDGVGTGLYEGSGKTVSSVMSNFMQQAQQSPLIGAAGQFMGNCTFGGACPNWSYDGGEMMGNVSFDLCNPALASLYGFAGALVMALAAFCAFRIAIY